jgi:hypothetical protein
MIEVNNDLSKALKRLNIIKNKIKEEANKHKFHLTRRERRRKATRKKEYNLKKKLQKTGKYSKG